MVTCVVPLPPSGTGNVNIEEAEKLLKPYLKRYPKVSPLPTRPPWPSALWIPVAQCPVDPHGPPALWTPVAQCPVDPCGPHACHCRAPSSCSLQGGLKPLKAMLTQ